MPRKPRGTLIPGKQYHVFNRGNWKNWIFFDENDKDFFLGKLQGLLNLHEIDVIWDGHCLMNNHYHLVLRQGIDVSISVVMQRLLTAYVRYFNTKYNKVGHVFQGRFKAKIIPNKQALRSLYKYLEKNPIKAGYVTKPEDYRWLSLPELHGGQA